MVAATTAEVVTEEDTTKEETVMGTEVEAATAKTKTVFQQTLEDIKEEVAAVAEVTEVVEDSEAEIETTTETEVTEVTKAVKVTAVASEVVVATTVVDTVEAEAAGIKEADRILQVGQTNLLLQFQ